MLSFHLIGHSVAFHAFYSFNLGRRLRITEHASCNWKEYSITGRGLNVLDRRALNALPTRWLKEATRQSNFGLSFHFCFITKDLVGCFYVFFFISSRYIGRKYNLCGSQWPRRLGRELYSPIRTLGSWIRKPLKAWMSLCVYSVFVVLYMYVAALRRALPPSKEFYRLCIKR
jgi:hypothetical protein